MSVAAADFRAGMRQLAAAVNVITTVHGGARAGMTATAVMSLTAEPPQLGIAVNRTASSFAAIAASGLFAINVLRHDQARLAGRFAGADGVRGDERFSEGTWGTLETGAPVLLDAAAAFDCRVVRTVDLSSHALFVGQVEAVRTVPTTTPLLFMDGTWASLVRASDHDFTAYEGVIREIDASMDAALASGGAPLDQLRQFSRRFAEISAGSVDVLREFFSRETVAPAARLDGINARKRDVEAKLRAILTRGVADGEFDVPDPAIAADAIIGMMNSIHRWPRARDAGTLDSGVKDSGVKDSETQDSGTPVAVGEQFGSLVTAMVSPRPPRLR